MSHLPDVLPILARRSAGGHAPAAYTERELTGAVDLCDARGRLNPQAVGWSRVPLVRANLAGHWPRKKRWNFWNWIGPRFVLTVTLADIDYASFGSVAFLDFETGERFAAMDLGRPRRFAMPEHVERTVAFDGRALRYQNHQEPGGAESRVHLRARAADATEIAAEFTVHTPPGHETLNIVVPWSAKRFQLNHKSNTLPCEGHIRVGARRYVLDPAECHGVQDFGRGLWPYRSFWNWGVVTGVQGRETIGVNFGARWTTGTGVNENGICLNGRLHKVMEDLDWSYDPGDWRAPWRVRSTASDVLDLTLQPVAVHASNLNLGILATGGACAFGLWRGTLRVEDRALPITDLIGWAEEFAHRW